MTATICSTRRLLTAVVGQGNGAGIGLMFVCTSAANRKRTDVSPLFLYTSTLRSNGSPLL